MSQLTDRVAKAIADLQSVLPADETHLRVRGKRVARLDLAKRNLTDWAATRAPALHVDERGGTSSIVEHDDRVEEGRLRLQVAADTRRLAVLLRNVERDASELARLVTRNVETVHPDKLPREEPGCRSCAREWRVKGTVNGSGHWAPVRKDATKHGLCDACYRHALAEMHDRGDSVVTSAHWPPPEYCDLLHRVSAAAAGRWLAKKRRKVSAVANA